MGSIRPITLTSRSSGFAYARLAAGPGDYDCSDDLALEAFHKLSECEGIIPALESSHALGWLLSLMGGQHPDHRLTPPPGVPVRLRGRSSIGRAPPLQGGG